MDNRFNMYGCDIEDYVNNVRKSFTYCASGSGMIIAALMSDAQEQMHFQDVESARQTLNKAKTLLFMTIEGTLKLNTNTNEE